MMLILALLCYMLSAACVPVFGGNPPYAQICKELAKKASPAALEHCATADRIIGLVFNSSIDMRGVRGGSYGEKLLATWLTEKMNAKRRSRKPVDAAVVQACEKLLDARATAKRQGTQGVVWFKAFFSHLGEPTNSEVGYTVDEIDGALAHAATVASNARIEAERDAKAKRDAAEARRQREIEEARRTEAERRAAEERARIETEAARQRAEAVRLERERLDAERREAEAHEERMRLKREAARIESERLKSAQEKDVSAGNVSGVPALDDIHPVSTPAASGQPQGSFNMAKNAVMIVALMLLFDFASHQDKSILTKLGSGIMHYAQSAFNTVKGWFAGAQEHINNGDDADSILQQFLDDRDNNASALTESVNDDDVLDAINTAQEELETMQNDGSLTEFIEEVQDLSDE